MIHAFLFDIGNVILEFDFSKAIHGIAAKSAINDPNPAMVPMRTATTVRTPAARSGRPASGFAFRAFHPPRR